MNRYPLVAIMMLLAVWVGGCTMPNGMAPATQYGYQPGSVILVGRVELDPPLDPESEQAQRWNVIGDGAVRNKLYLATGPEPVPLGPSNERMADWAGHIDATLGETFMLRAPRETTWIRGAKLVLDAAAGDEVWFPGGLYYRVPEKARAIYIGTLRYHRGDFYKITGIEVEDGYQAALAVFRTAFGSDARLEKALLAPAGDQVPGQ